MNRGGAEAQRENQITEIVIGCAIEIHRALGPGLLESAYEECLCYELKEARLSFRRQVLLPLNYKGVRLDCGYIMDVVVEDLIVIELKTVERILPIHEAQLITYLKLSGHSVGLLMNFNVALMKSGIRRLVNMFHEISAPPRLRG
jgi:GxxExxY protein